MPKISHNPQMAEKGFGLIEVLVASGILIGLLYALTTAVNFLGRSIQTSRVDTDFYSLVSQVQSLVSNSTSCQTVLSPYTINPAGGWPQNLTSAITSTGTGAGMVVVPLPPANVGSSLQMTKLQFTSATPIGSSTTQYLVNLHIEASKSLGNGGAVGLQTASHDFPVSVTLSGTHQIIACSGVSSIWQWAANNTDIYFNGGNVGIGTTAPTKDLDIERNVDGPATMRVENSSMGTNVFAQFEAANGTGGSGGAFGIRGQGAAPWGVVGPNDTYLLSYTRLVVGPDTNTSPLVFVTGDTTGPQERARFSPAGNFGIANSAPSVLLDVGSPATIGAVAKFENSSGSCTITPAAGMSCSSDERLKENFEEVGEADALDRILALQAYRYNFKRDPAKGQQTGYKAQEIQQVLPELVRKNNDGYLEVFYSRLMPWVTESIKALYDRSLKIEASERSHQAELKTRLDRLERENAELKARLERLEKAGKSK